MKTRRVLVVDDDPIVSKSFDRVLALKGGYAVITAASGEEALVKIENEHYDAVFTDIKMTGMNGVEVARQIKATQPWMPVVIVTGYGSEAYRLQAEALGVTQFLDKPLSPDDIERSVETALAETVKPEVIETIAEESVEQLPRSVIRDIFLFFAAPFIGLAYILVAPFAGLLYGLWALSKRVLKSKDAIFIAKMIASPLIGLAFAVLGPIIGLGMLARVSLLRNQ